MKKARKAIVMTFLMLVAVGAYFVSGTYAKYTSTATGEATARVAKWSFKVGGSSGTDIATSNEFTFNLFNTVLDTVDGETDEDVTSSNSDKVIAPGTKGSFDIVLYNASEVSAKYAIDYAVTTTLPLEFSTNGSTWAADLTDVEASDSAKLTANGGTVTKTVYWRWAYDSTDTDNFNSSITTPSDLTDTSFGTTGTATAVVSAVVTATQVD